MSATVVRSASLPLGLLSAAGFLSIAGARVVDPLLRAMAADFHVSVPETSVVVAAFTLAYGLNQLLLGPLGDRYGKLRVLLGALAGYVLATGACAFASGLPTLTLLRAAAGAASGGLIPIAMAYIGDAIPYKDRQVVLGRFLTGVVLAQILAGPLGGVFGEYVGWRGVFLVLAFLALLAALALGLRLPDVPDPRNEGAMFEAGRYGSLLRRPAAWLLLAATFAEGALFAGSFPFLAPYLHDAFDLSYTQVGLILACFGLGAFAYTRGTKQLLQRLGEAGMVLLGGLTIAVALVAGVRSGGWQAFVPVEVLLGIGYLSLHGVLQARATELLPETRATAVSCFILMLFVGQSVGALLMGGAIAVLGYAGAFEAQAACVLVLTICLFALVRRPAA